MQMSEKLWKNSHFSRSTTAVAPLNECCPVASLLCLLQQGPIRVILFIYLFSFQKNDSPVAMASRETLLQPGTAGSTRTHTPNWLCSCRSDKCFHYATKCFLLVQQNVHGVWTQSQLSWVDGRVTRRTSHQFVAGSQWQTNSQSHARAQLTGRESKSSTCMQHFGQRKVKYAVCHPFRIQKQILAKDAAIPTLTLTTEELMTNLYYVIIQNNKTFCFITEIKPHSCRNMAIFF